MLKDYFLSVLVLQNSIFQVFVAVIDITRFHRFYAMRNALNRTLIDIPQA